MSDSEAIHHHLVSRGLQNDFADDENMVTIIDARTGVVVNERQRATSDGAEDAFNSFVTPAGVLDAELEQRWAGIEPSALELARAVSPANAQEDETRAAVCEVFAYHLARSHAYLEAHRDLAEPATDEREGDDEGFVDSVARVYDEVATYLAARHVQVISTPTELPGFVLSDVPVVHADSRTRRYGFRDGLAVEDADLIVGPLTRRTAVCLTVEPLEHFTVTTKKATQLINAAFWRSARALVACHPDDTREARRVFAHLADLPVAKLLG